MPVINLFQQVWKPAGAALTDSHVGFKSALIRGLI
jgi:hypothetical protein